MKIKGKEIKTYEPEWCCNVLCKVMDDGEFNFNCDNTQIVIGTPFNFIIQYCPFCGEKIEI